MLNGACTVFMLEEVLITSSHNQGSATLSIMKAREEYKTFKLDIGISAVLRQDNPSEDLSNVYVK